MIRYIKRDALNIEKYNSCISQALNSRIYAYSWYLDIVTDTKWDVLVLDDYKAVMPLPWRRKYFVKYVYPPFWLLELGVFSTLEEVDFVNFFKETLNHFKFIELKMNTGNIQDNIVENVHHKQFQFLSLHEDYELLKNNYRKDRKKDLQNAFQSNLVVKWYDAPEKLVQLFKNNVGKRIPNIKEKDYRVLLNLISSSLKKGVGEIVSIYDANNKLVASAFLLKHEKSVTILVSSTDFNNRENGANTFLIDRIIYKYHKNFNKFSFGGSSINSIAQYFKSYGAQQEEYYLLKYNNIPKILRFLKH